MDIKNDVIAAIGNTPSSVLAEQKGRTTLTTTVRHESQAARDGILKSGMEQVVAASYDRPEERLAETSNAI